MKNVNEIDEEDSKVRLFYEQRTALASVVEAFAAALRAFAPIRKGDFDDVIREIAHYRESPCPCGKPSGVPTGGSVFCPEHTLEFGD
jgi:hypothetical protein